MLPQVQEQRIIGDDVMVRYIIWNYGGLCTTRFYARDLTLASGPLCSCSILMLYHRMSHVTLTVFRVIKQLNNEYI